MAVTTITTAGTHDKGNVVSRWSAEVAREYIKEEEFAPWSGQKEGSVFRYRQELTKESGDNITFSLVAKLSGAGVEDDDPMNPEALGNFADTVTIHQIRHGVTIGNHEQTKTEIEVLNEARFMLKEWAMEQLRDLKIARLESPHLDGVTTYAAATEAQKDAHLTANTDRYLFGELLSNYSAGDHSASLLNVDDTSDTLKRSIMSLAKRIAESATPLIRPIKIDGVRQHYVAFCGVNPHRDYKIDLDTIHALAAPRENGMNNPMWRDDDLVFEDIVVRKVPAKVSVGAVGAAACPIYHVSLCGAETVLVGWGEHIKSIRNGPEGEDWGNLKGAGVKETRGAKKTHYNSKQHGMVSIYVASAADA